MKRLPEWDSMYSSRLPEYSSWRERSKSVRLWIPSNSFQPKGYSYSMSKAFLA